MKDDLQKQQEAVSSLIELLAKLVARAHLRDTSQATSEPDQEPYRHVDDGNRDLLEPGLD